MEEVEVTARFQDGRIIPISITRANQLYPVSSTGRQWEAGGEWHILVMLPNERVYTVIFRPDLLRWYLHPVAPEHPSA